MGAAPPERRYCITSVVLNRIAVCFDARQTITRVGGPGYIWGIGAKTKRTAQMTMTKATNITA